MDHLALATVLETDDSFALSLAKASLEDAGIDYLVAGDDPRYIAGFRLPLAHSSCPRIRS
jgi:hypothetical protein